MPTEEKVTLVVPFKKIFTKFTQGDPDKEYLMSAGSWESQAQKVNLETCPAMMVRPPMDKYPWALDLALEVATNYGLLVQTIGTHLGREIWIYHPDYEEHLSKMQEFPENSPGWHLIRACLCGIPFRKVDFAYHLRKGYGEFTS